MEKVCFNKRSLTDNMLHALQPEKLIKVLNITNNMENYVEPEVLSVLKKLCDKPKKLKKKSSASDTDLKLPSAKAKKKKPSKPLRLTKK